MEKSEKKEEKQKRERKPIDKGKLAKNMVVIVMVVALLFSVAASLIFNVIYYARQ